MVAWWYFCSQKKHRPELADVKGRGSKLNLRLKEVAAKVEDEEGRQRIRVCHYITSCSEKHIRCLPVLFFSQKLSFVHKASLCGICRVNHIYLNTGFCFICKIYQHSVKCKNFQLIWEFFPVVGGIELELLCIYWIFGLHFLWCLQGFSKPFNSEFYDKFALCVPEHFP